MTVTQAQMLLTDLRRRNVQIAVAGPNLRINAPKGTVSEDERAALRKHKAELLARLRIEAGLLQMSFEEFGDADKVVEISVPWLKKHLWLVPMVRAARRLVDQGVDRGCIWTAAELTDLYAIDGLQQNDRRAIATLKAHFNIEIVSVKPDDPPDSLPVGAASPGRCRSCHGTRFWRSVHGATVCASCHPPAQPDLVAEWVSGGLARETSNDE